MICIALAEFQNIFANLLIQDFLQNQPDQLRLQFLVHLLLLTIQEYQECQERHLLRPYLEGQEFLLYNLK